MRLARVLPLLLLAACATVDTKRGATRVTRLVEERAASPLPWRDGTPEDAELAAFVDRELAKGLDPERAAVVALVNAPALRATYEELGISQAEVVQAGLLPNPRLGGSVGWGITGPVFEWETSLLADFLGSLIVARRVQIAEQQFEAEVLRVTHEALATAAHARQALVEVQARTALVDLHRQIVETHAATAELARRRFEAGNLTELELAELEAEYERAKIELANEELALVDDREHVNRLLGLWGPRTAWKLDGGLRALPASEAPTDDLETLALQRRLDVDAARKQLLVVGNALELATTTRFTGLVEVGLHMHQDADGPRVFGPVLELELPVFDQRQALLARLEAQQRQARRRLDAVSVDARSEVRAARTRLLTARRIAEHVTRTVLPLRTRALEQAQLQYNGMQLGPDALFAGKRMQLEAARALVESLRDYWVARAEVDRVLGIRLDAPPPAKGTGPASSSPASNETRP